MGYNVGEARRRIHAAHVPGVMKKTAPDAGGSRGGAVDWAAWLQEYGARLLLYARQQTRSEADAEDVMQEALVQLVHAVDSGSFQGGPPQWLSYAYTAIRHQAMDKGRREEVRKQYAEREQDGMQEGVADEPWLHSAADDEYLRRRVEDLLKKLPKEYAEVVVLKIWGEHTFQEIADMTSTKLATITSRYRYAMQAMRKALDDTPIDR